MLMSTSQVVSPFSALLQDVSTLHVVSRLQRSKGPSPEEQVETAKQEARKIAKVEGFKEGLSSGHAEGFKQGYDEAFAQAYQEAADECNKRLDEMFGSLNQHVAAVNAEIPKWFENAEELMMQRTMEIVKRVLASELEIGRDHALAIVKESLAEITHSDHIRIRMNPFDSIVISQHKDELMALAPQLKDIEFVDDQSIRGGCIVESHGGAVDATLDTRLTIVQGDLAA